jgi:Glycosyl hydrolase family 67 N-terminus.
MKSSREDFLRRGVGALALSLASSPALRAVVGPAPAAVVIDARWRIVTGSDPLERVAGEDLKALLARERGVALAAPVSQDGGSGSSGARRILVGTPRTHPEIAREHAARPFRVSPAEAEGYHLAYRGGNLYVVGGGSKGAMNGAFRLLARETLDVGALDEARSPAFRLRIGGHRMNQTPPPNWSEDDQARYYARQSINVVWGEKVGPPLSYEARRKYGLGLMVEVLFPPGGGERLNDPALAEAVYYEKKGNEKRRALDPFHPAGRAVYLQYLREALEANPDVRVLYGVFADYNAIPGEQSVRVSDGKDYGRTRSQTMQEILRLMREAIGDRPVTATAWLWHAFFADDAGEAAFMEWAAREGYGLLYNEAGNSDNWLLRRSNFSPLTLRTGADGKSAWGPHFISLVSAGGACESVNPVIALPLPFVAAGKIRALAKAGVPNVCLWWGSAEGWVYDSNLRVVTELFWNPAEEPEALVRRVGQRDFGPALAPAVWRFWREFDAALPTTRPLYRRATVEDQGDPATDGLRLYDWWQRMGIFTEWVFGGRFYYELTPDRLAPVNDLGNRGYWGVSPFAHANYGIVLERLEAATNRLEAELKRAKAAPELARRNAQDLLRWSTLYRRLLRSQYNFCRALTVFQGFLPEGTTRPKGGATPEELKTTENAARTLAGDSALRAALAPVVRDEIANTEALIALAAEFPPSFNIGAAQREVFEGKWPREKEVGKLRARAEAMRAYLSGSRTSEPAGQTQAGR